MELLLIRHALPVRRELVEGAADPALAETGRAQAELLAAYLATEELHALYTSPMLRARQTAEPLARTQSLEPVVEEGVAEWDREASEYIPVEELKRTGDPRWTQMVSGDWSDRDIDPVTFQAIVVNALDRVVDAHPSQKVAVVCHGGVINMYLAHVLRLPEPSVFFFYPNYTSVHRIAAARSGERSIIAVNETAHLRGSGLHHELHR